MFFFFYVIYCQSEQAIDHFMQLINFDSVIVFIINYFKHQIPLLQRRSIRLSEYLNFLFNFYLEQILP